MFKVKLIIAFCLSLVLALSATACNDKSEDPVSQTHYELLNTVSSISIYGMEESKANKILDDAFELCRKEENLLSKTVKGSDIYNINEADGEMVEISKETYGLLKKSIHYAELSEGKFDVTIGELATLWDFMADNPRVPEDEDIKARLTHINYQNLVLETKDGAYFGALKEAGASVDLGGIAKGYIADKVSAYLEKRGVERALVNLGGNIVAIGQKNEEQFWKIGVEKPYSERSEIVGYVEVGDATVVTSGIYERGFEENGKIYHHILDVKTGYPVESDVEAVSIRTDKNKSADADALSSICLIIGSKKGLELIEGLDGVEASFILRNGQIVTTKNMNLVKTV